MPAPMHAVAVQCNPGDHIEVIAPWRPGRHAFESRIVGVERERKHVIDKVRETVGKVNSKAK